MWKALIGVVAVAVCAESACAAEWHVLEQSGDKPRRVAWFIDTAEIAETPLSKRAWFTIVFEDRQAPAAAIQLMEFNCKAGQFRAVQTTEEDWSGNRLALDVNRDWTFAVPETTAEAALKTTCGLKPVIGDPIHDPIAAGRYLYAHE